MKVHLGNIYRELDAMYMALRFVEDNIDTDGQRKKVKKQLDKAQSLLADLMDELIDEMEKQMGETK